MCHHSLHVAQTWFENVYKIVCDVDLNIIIGTSQL